MGGGRQGGGGDDETAPRVSIARLASLGSGTGLFGRKGDLDWLDACWAGGAHVASVVAFGGVGKSALVWEWLAGMRDAKWRRAGRAVERVYGWSFYSQGTKDQMTSADPFVAAALAWFGDPNPDAGSPWDKGERLARCIQERPTLLVLDGVEPLQWGPGPEEGRIKDPALATLVRELGAQNPGMCVITSRLAVRDLADLAGERCRRRDLSTLDEEAGAALLRARGVKKGAEEELREAAREYGGHSLALALLGSYLQELGKGVGDVRRRSEIGPLEEDERLGGHARRVMVAYEKMLGGRSIEVGILQMLGLFDRPAGEGEIAALRAEPVVPGLTEALVGLGDRAWSRAIARLRRVGLLAHAESEGDRSLDAHPLVRDHFGEQLRREREEAWREGHRRLYEHLRATAKERPETLEEMAPLHEAVVHGCLAGKRPDAFDSVWWARIKRKNEHFSTRNLGAFGSEVAALAAFFDPPWERLAPGLTGPEEATVLNCAGIALFALGRPMESAKVMRMALALRIAEENWSEASLTASNLSELERARGALRDAVALAQHSVDLASMSPDDGSWHMASRATLAAVQHDMGLQEEAVAHFEEAERFQKKVQPEYPMLYSLRGFRYCSLLLDQERDADVLERATQTLKWAKAHFTLRAIALDHLSIGRAHFLASEQGTAGDLVEAADNLKRAVDGLRDAGRQDHLPSALLARASLHTHTRAFDLVRHDLDEAHRIAILCGFRLHETDAHLGLARLALAEEDPARALDHLATARKIIEETGYHRRDRELDGLDAEARAMRQPAPPPEPGPPGESPPVPVAAPPAPRPVTPEPAMTRPLKLFYSYSRKDEAHREKLVAHLALLRREGLIEDWHDRKIGAGTEWAGAINDNLAAADIVLLLVSSDFIASDYCVDEEMRHALARHDAKEALVVPIAVRPCDWSNALFAKLQGLPKNTKPVTKWANRDEAWTDVAKGIRRAIEDLRKSRSDVAEQNASPP